MNKWESIKSAPKNATSIRVKMKDGTIHEDAHWACGGGCEQPRYEGWFVPYNKGRGFYEIDQPTHWQPISANKKGKK